MPATSLDIISLEEIKQELDLPQTHTSEDAKLTRHIAQAVDTTARIVGRSLLDIPVKVYGEIPVGGGEKPLVFFGRDLMYSDKDELKYWTVNADLNTDPDGTIDNISRSVKRPEGLVLYRSMDWPKFRTNTKAELRTTKGVEEVPLGLKSAIIILVRHLYGGFEKTPMSYGDLVSPYRRVTPEDGQ